MARKKKTDEAVKVDEITEELESENTSENEYLDTSLIEDDYGYKGLLIPSGSTMLNLACSDSWKGAYRPGRMVNIIGDSSAGKTLLALSMFGEMGLYEDFDEYRFIYDDAEHALDIDLEKMLGEETAERIEPPDRDDEGNPKYSDTIEDFHYNVMQAIKAGKPFVYVLDSFDSLTAVDELENTEASLKALKEGKKPGGTYGTEKARLASRMLRQIVSKIKETKSLVVIISQTRDNLDATSFSKKTRSGGKALKFYSSHEIWLALKGKLKKTVSGLSYNIGVEVVAKVTKNKLTGKLRDVTFPIYYEYGVDDISACLDFLLTTKNIEKTKNTLKIPELGLEGSKNTIIQAIEEDADLWIKLYKFVNKKWMDIENKLSLNRANKFKARRRK